MQVQLAIELVNEAANDTSVANPSTASSSLAIAPQGNGDTLTLLFPPKAVSLIIGPHGSNIKQVRFSSGARVDTDKTTSDTQPVKFRGSDQQVQQAVTMVYELVAAEDPGALSSIVCDGPMPQWLPPVMQWYAQPQVRQIKAVD